MELNLQNLFSMPAINGTTINGVPLSASFVRLLYVFMAVILLVSIFISLRKYIFLSALKKAVMITFFAAGIVYAIHADIGWSVWLINDDRTFAGLTTDEKLSRMEGGLYNFALAAGKVVGDDYELYSSDNSLSLRMEYFLLPHRKREQAQYIIVLVDNQAQYDQTSRTFTSGNVKIEHVAPVLVFARDAYVLKRISS